MPIGSHFQGELCGGVRSAAMLAVFTGTVMVFIATVDRIPIINTDPGGPLFAATVEGAMCSGITLGLDFAPTLTGDPARPEPDRLPNLRCGDPSGSNAQYGPWGLGASQLVAIEVDGRLVRAFVNAPSGDITGLLIIHAGLGVPAESDMGAHIAAAAVAGGRLVIRLIRDQGPDAEFRPLGEARDALNLAADMARHCKIPDARIDHIGWSLGGLVALLAARDSGSGRVAVLDPALDPMSTASHLAGLRFSPAAIAMGQFFARMLADRFGGRASMVEWIEEARTAGTWSDDDAPARWFCDISDSGRYGIWLSESDPALGATSREVVEACGSETVRKLDVSGHVPIACARNVVAEMVLFVN